MAGHILNMTGFVLNLHAEDIKQVELEWGGSVTNGVTPFIVYTLMHSTGVQCIGSKRYMDGTRRGRPR